MLTPPLNIPKWLSENSHLLQPPINNHCVHSAGPNHDMTIMIVGGPNARTDYHINPTPELFYQYKGSMLLRVVDKTVAAGNAETGETGLIPESESLFKDIPIREGELFLLPGNTPHNPIRFANTVGIVVEISRPEGISDRLRWYCQSCRCIVFETTVKDLGPGLKGAVQSFANDEEKRKCKNCGELCDVQPRNIVQPT